MTELSEKAKISFKFKELIEELNENSFFLFAERKIEKVKYGNKSFDNWSIATIVIKKVLK